MPEGKEIADCGLPIADLKRQRAKVDFRSKIVNCRLETGQTGSTDNGQKAWSLMKKNPYETSSSSYCLLLISGFNCLLVNYLFSLSSKKSFTGMIL